MKILLNMGMPFSKVLKFKKSKGVVPKSKGPVRGVRTASVRLVEEALLKYAA